MNASQLNIRTSEKDSQRFKIESDRLNVTRDMLFKTMLENFMSMRPEKRESMCHAQVIENLKSKAA